MTSYRQASEKSTSMRRAPGKANNNPTQRFTPARVHDALCGQAAAVGDLGDVVQRHGVAARPREVQVRSRLQSGIKSSRKEEEMWDRQPNGVSNESLTTFRRRFSQLFK